MTEARFLQTLKKWIHLIGQFVNWQRFPSARSNRTLAKTLLFGQSANGLIAIGVISEAGFLRFILEKLVICKIGRYPKACPGMSTTSLHRSFASRKFWGGRRGQGKDFVTCLGDHVEKFATVFLFSRASTKSTVHSSYYIRLCSHISYPLPNDPCVLYSKWCHFRPPRVHLSTVLPSHPSNSRTKRCTSKSQLFRFASRDQLNGT